MQRTGRLAPYAENGGGGTAIVTGGNTGIGLETVKVLAQAGMRVILCSRRLEAGFEAKASLPDNVQNRIDVRRLDLADLSSVQAFAEEIIAGKNRIDLLVNNAGVSDRKQREVTAQGLELQFGTNHVGHHMLTRLLLPACMDRGTGGRIVTVSSRAHNFAVNSTDWGGGGYPSPYAQSKLANILFAKALDDRLSAEGAGAKIRSVSLHPGAIGTNIWKNTPSYWKIGETFFLDKNLEQGAATTAYCSFASGEEIVGGGYYSDCSLVRPSSLARDDDRSLRNNLWETSERIIASKGYVLPPNLI